MVTDLVAAGSSVWSLGSIALLDGLTIVRIRGELSLYLSVVTTVFDGFQRWAAGICIVSENAATVGVTAIPASLTDIGWDGWMWHHSAAGMAGFSTAETGQSVMEAVRIPIDTKAMRKLRETDVVVGVIEMGTEIGTATVRYAAQTRMLSKLP